VRRRRKGGEKGTAEPETARAAGTPEGELLCVLREGGAADPATDPRLPEPALRALFEGMLRTRLVDERLATLRKQGRIHFHSAVAGQEASVLGAAAALEPSDPVFPAFREWGVALWRGMPLEGFLAQCFGSSADPQLGRQVPCHAADRELGIASGSSCVGTQLPHAVGYARAARQEGDRVVVAAFFGDGATSSGDFHAALTLAGIWRAPVLFLCQNNQWSISLPVEKQTAASTLAAKARSYGIEAARVDGNDVLAVYRAVRDAAERLRRGEGPMFLELVTWRMGAHSYADDPSRYRDEEVTRAWEGRDPIRRLRDHLRAAGIWTQGWEEGVRERQAREVAEAVAKAESQPPPLIETLFDDVWRRTPPGLEEQRRELLGTERAKE